MSSVGVSLATVKLDLRFARAWLAAELGGQLAGRVHEYAL